MDNEKTSISSAKNLPTKSRKERREEFWKNKKKIKNNSKNDKGHSESNMHLSPEKSAQRNLASPIKKLRNRDTIAKPDSLKYEPNLNRGFHAKIIESLCQDTSNKNKNKNKTQNNGFALKRTKNYELEKESSPKKVKVNTEGSDIFDPYTFSMALINAQDNSSETKIVKDSEKKYVLFIGNLPYDVTKEQLEEHFRISRGIKSIRIPKAKGRDQGEEQGRGFAYMEFENRISHGIALRLHHTTLGGRKINVEFTSIGGGNSKARKEKLQQKNKKRWKKISLKQ